MHAMQYDAYNITTTIHISDNITSAITISCYMSITITLDGHRRA